MATVTKPIALDESINTTELTPRNIADVLAEELARIAENILPPNAEDIAYDNTASGLTATNVQDAIDEVISSQADVIADTMADLTENKTATVTDGVADFETIDGSLVKSLVVEIEPSQSGTGTPSPDNIRPITGWTQEDVLVVGKNLYDGTALVNSRVRYDTGNIEIQSGMYASYYISVLPNKQYTLNFSYYSVGSYGMAFFDSSQNYLSGIKQGTSTGNTPFTFTTPNNCHYLRFSMTISPSEVQLELGSSVTAYEPYKGKTYSTSFGQTVYGGTLDVLSGELTITHGYALFDGSSDEYWLLVKSNNRAYVSVSDITTSVADNETVDITSSSYKTTSYVEGAGNPSTPSITGRYNNSQINIFDSAIITSDLTVDGWRTYLSNNPVEVVYPLATPTTLSLTPQTVKSLVGENHISASTGDVLECKFSMLINGDDLAILLS